MTTNQDRILELIEKHPEGLDDDEISETTGVQPRQQVYLIGTRLKAEGKIRRTSIRKPGKRQKIHNFPLHSTTATEEDSSPERESAWRRRLSMLVAATGRSEDDILDQALTELSIKLLREEFSDRG